MGKERYQLSKISTRAPSKLDREETKEKTQELVKRIAELQDVMFAEDKWSLLIVLQGMDASGKDGLIKKVFEGANPQGCRVQSFRAPTAEELAHDFLWRIHTHIPSKGMIQIFNRSHYEDVVIVRVHKWIDESTVQKRFALINSFEEGLRQHKTVVLKFYLHVSPEEQLKRLKERLADPKKRWKYNPKDLEERKLWGEYMKAYEDVFENCSPEIPWTIIPADQNWYKEYLAAKTIVDALEPLNMKYPAVPDVD